MKAISKDLLNNILALINQGYSMRAIASRLNVSKSTVSRIYHQHHLSFDKLIGGRPVKLTSQDRRSLVRFVTSGVADNAVKAAKMLSNINDSTVSACTVRRALKDSGLKAIVKQKKPLLSARHRKLRMDFAFRYENWTVEDWKRVVWSDETKINRLGSDGRQWA